MMELSSGERIPGRKGNCLMFWPTKIPISSCMNSLLRLIVNAHNYYSSISFFLFISSLLRYNELYFHF